MQIITRRVTEGVVIDGRTSVKVVELGIDEVTFEITDADGETRSVTLSVATQGRATDAPSAASNLVSC